MRTTAHSVRPPIRRSPRRTPCRDGGAQADRCTPVLSWTGTRHSRRCREWRQGSGEVSDRTRRRPRVREKNGEVVGCQYLLVEHAALRSIRSRLWSQMSLSAISGPNAGRALQTLADWERTTWDAWCSAHPKSRVVTPRTTGFHLPDHSDRYRGYFHTEALDRRFQDLATDERLPNKTLVIGVRSGTTISAYPSTSS